MTANVANSMLNERAEVAQRERIGRSRAIKIVETSSDFLLGVFRCKTNVAKKKKRKS